jgi:hypothetical protein
MQTASINTVDGRIKLHARQGRDRSAKQSPTALVNRGGRCKPYSIAGINGSGLFDPIQQGIEPIAISTACWRGYHCVYVVADGAPLLTKLHIGLNPRHVRMSVHHFPTARAGAIPVWLAFCLSRHHYVTSVVLIYRKNAALSSDDRLTYPPSP